MLGYQELLIIFVLVLLFFGGRKIPEVARGLGKGLNEFKKAKDGITDSLDSPPEESDSEVTVAEADADTDGDADVKKEKKNKKNKKSKKKKKKEA